MFDKEFILQYFNDLNKRIEREQIYERELKIEFVKQKVIAIIGPRRAGKTYYLLGLLKKNPKNTFYIDLEHSAFKDIEHKDLFEIIHMVNEYFKLEIKNIIIDEIQNLKEWEKLARSVIDSGFNLIVSGSSSKLLSKEIATQLRGRSLTYLMLPLSFREFLSFKKMEIRKLVSLSDKVKLLRELDLFLEWGGYPEIVIDSDKKEKILKDYIETTLQKDFIERFEIAHISIAKFIFEFVIQNYSKDISINKIAKFVSSQLRKNVKNIVYDYVEKLPETLSVFFLEKYSESIYKRKSVQKKVYIVDTGLANLYGFTKDLGKRMENAVFAELMRKTNENPMLSYFYWKDYQQRETDFVVKDGSKVKSLIQVTYVSDKTEIEEREIRSLLKAGEELKCDDLMIITWGFKGEEIMENRKIIFKPLWEWLLDVE